MQCKSFSHFFNKNICIFQVLTFVILPKSYLTMSLVLNNRALSCNCDVKFGLYIAPVDKTHNGLVNLSSNCDVKSGLIKFSFRFIMLKISQPTVAEKEYVDESLTECLLFYLRVGMEGVRFGTHSDVN